MNTSDRLKAIVAEIEGKRIEGKRLVRCTCDLDNWQPDLTTGHSWVCDIHKKAMSIARTERSRVVQEAVKP